MNIRIKSAMEAFEMENAEKSGLVHVDCILCNSPNHYSIIKSLSLGKERANLVKCNGCGLVYITPRRSHSDVVATYETDSLSQSSYYSDGIQDDLSTFNSRLSFIKKFMSEKTAVLDIGASVGTFLHVCQQNGFK
jgi:hypothetical protein